MVVKPDIAWLLHATDVAAADRPASAHACAICGATFPSKAAAAAHMQKIHSIPSQATAHVRGTACQACQKEFWTSERLRDHLRHQSWCLQAYVEADLPSILLHERDCNMPMFMPATTLIGPRPFWATLLPAPQSSAHVAVADPRLDEFRAVLDLADGLPNREQIFYKLTPKLLRLHGMCEGLSDMYDDLLMPTEQGRFALHLSQVLGQALSTKCEQFLEAGWLQIRGAGLFGDPSTLPSA